MYRLARAILFKFDAESVHGFVMTCFDALMWFTPIRRLTAAMFRVSSPNLEVEVFGIRFPNPVGLAAGFDKNAEHVNPLAALGFGHIEIGTVTGQEQAGNPKPRMFRLPADKALLNRMGFNNHGSEKVAARLARLKPETVLGINIGKTKVVALEDAEDDYDLSFRRLYEYGSYFVVNVSSPNTPGLRELQDKEPLSRILNRLMETNRELADTLGHEPKPLLVKIAPDLTDAQVIDAVDVAKECGLSGLVAANTTIQRDTLKTPNVDALGAGGISGVPTRRRRNEIIRLMREHTDLPIIGVGGIFGPEDAREALDAGANLVQVWTGFVYEGPGLVRRINKALAAG